jgi:hypothetical protein
MSENSAPRKDDDLDSIMEKEKQKLLKKREDLEAKRQTIDTDIEALNAKLSRIDNYFNPGKPATAPRKPRATPTGTRAPRGEHRSKITEALKANPTGLSGGEIIDKLGARGDKKQSQAIANALANMKKANEIRTEGAGKASKYFAV